MPPKVNISTATTGVEASATPQVANAISQAGSALSDVSQVATQFHRMQKRDEAEQKLIDDKANNVLSKFQFNEGNTLISDRWGTLNAKIKNRYDEDEVFNSIDTRYDEDLAFIDNNTDYTDEAKAALREILSVNKVNARNTFKNNKSTAMTKASLDSLDRQVTMNVNQMDAESAAYSLQEAVDNALLDEGAADNILNDVIDKINVIGYERRIEGIVDQKIKVEGETSLDTLTNLAQEIKRVESFTAEKRSALLAQVSAAKSKNIAGQAQLMQQANLYIAGNDTPSAYQLIQEIEDPDIKDTYMLKLGLSNDAFINEQMADIEKNVIAANAKKLKVTVKEAEEIALAQAQESATLITQHQSRPYAGFDPEGRAKRIKPYDMTPAVHLQKLKLSFSMFKAGLPVPNINTPKDKYTGSTADKYLMQEIDAIGNKEQRQLLQDEFLLYKASTESNGNYYDVDEKAKFTRDKYFGGHKMQNIYPKDLQGPIQEFEDMVASNFDSLNIDPTDADYSLLKAMNDGRDIIQASYRNDPGAFKANKVSIIESATRDFMVIANRMKVENSIISTKPAPTTPTIVATEKEIQEAIKWIKEHPNDPRVPQLKANLGI